MGKQAITLDCFEDVPMLGKLSPQEAAIRPHEAEEEQAAEALLDAAAEEQERGLDTLGGGPA